MLVCGVVPFGFVIFYSLHDTFAGNSFIWVGADWYRSVLSSGDFWWSAVRSGGFAILALLVEVPLGLWIALRMPASGRIAAVCLTVFAVPLFAPLVVVGYLWKVMTLPDVGLLHAALGAVGVGLDMNSKVVTWVVLLLMDAWHWTGLVVLLCYAGLRAIPDSHYRAAAIDGAGGWAVFRYVQLPRLKLVLLVAILLRLMDAFTIYTEAYVVSRGGPDVSTTFLSHELVQTGLIQFDLGEAAAMSVICFAVVVAVSWAFFRVVVPPRGAAGGGR